MRLTLATISLKFDWMIETKEVFPTNNDPVTLRGEREREKIGDYVSVYQRVSHDEEQC